MTADASKLVDFLRREAAEEYMPAQKDMYLQAADALEAARVDAERWRYLKNECTHHYGDGYSEPREAHLCLAWGQGPWIRDGSNGGRGRPDVFPGWDAIVDEMIAQTAAELADLDDTAIDAAMADAARGEGGV